MTEKINKIRSSVKTGYTVLEKLNKAEKDYADFQQNTLLEILKANSSTEYGLKYRFSDIENPNHYREMVPLTTYRVYKPYVQQLLEGKQNLLCSERLTGFASTSATSGNQKYIPQNLSVKNLYQVDYAFRAFALADQQSLQLRGEHLGDGYALILIGSPVQFLEEQQSASKLALSSIGATSLQFVDEGVKNFLIPPVKLLTELASTVENMNYLYLRFSLACRDILYAASIYDDYCLGLFRYLEKNWSLLCDEIEEGTHRFGNLDLEMEGIAEYKSFLQADPDRAEELRDILKDGLQEDTLHRIWPKLTVFSAAAKKGTFVEDTGLTKYLKDIAYDNSPYGATESLFGVAAGLNDPRIQLIPDACYFEFIPYEKAAKENPATLRMDQVVDGEVYELVVTTRAGLYRYRIGDLLKVTGRKGDCPLFTFQGRRGIGIDLASEKAPEEALRNALTVAAVKCRVSINACCMYGEGNRFNDDTGSSLRYVVQFETKKELTDSEKEAFAREIDHQIGNIVKSYQAARQSGLLLPLRIQQLPSGSFQSYEDKMRALSLNPSQYKRPFIMKLGDF